MDREQGGDRCGRVIRKVREVAGSKLSKAMKAIMGTLSLEKKWGPLEGFEHEGHHALIAESHSQKYLHQKYKVMRLPRMGRWGWGGVEATAGIQVT